MISSVLPNEAGYVDVREGGHQVLTVEAIHDAAVSWDGAGKVLQGGIASLACVQVNVVVCHSLKRHEMLFFKLNTSFLMALQTSLSCSAVLNNLSQQRAVLNEVLTKQ